MTTSRPIAALERRLGYRFSDPSLLERAVTHRSWAHDQTPPGEDYERLEFLGDAVLGLAVAHALFEDPSASEGRLTRARAEIVCKESLAATARKLELGQWLRLGRGEEMTGGRDKDSILSDALEAVLGAVYCDGGMDEAAALVRRTMGESLQQRDAGGGIVAPVDTRSLLQERLQERGRSASYRVSGCEGEAHAPVWSVELLIDGEVVATGTGGSKQQASTRAAARAMAALSSEWGEAPADGPQERL